MVDTSIFDNVTSPLDAMNAVVNSAPDGMIGAMMLLSLFVILLTIFLIQNNGTNAPRAVFIASFATLVLGLSMATFGLITLGKYTTILMVMLAVSALFSFFRFPHET